MKKTLNWALSATALAICIGCGEKAAEPQSETPAGSTPPATTASVSYTEIQDTFNKNCITCHGENGNEGVDLRTYESVMKGGEPGPIVKPGDPEASLLVHVLRASHGKKQMPPKGPLPEEQIAKVEAWIKAGANNS